MWLIFCGTVFLSAMFPVFFSPISMGGILITISFFLTSLLCMTSSMWYGYILFLVYIGGLLVLFIYVCMVSSNYPLILSQNSLMMAVIITIVTSSFMQEVGFKKFLGNTGWDNGSYLSLILFLGLVVLLLLAFLAVARIIISGGSLKIEPSN
uniref:NADH dehydrogenase subunit 6 n=1 Tax=Carychium tridentatum TaxID=145635 RepID=A0A1S5R314_9EUPU|nr:NADH dehydrogenase subunit 6 [Carychium tridentatum]